MGKSSAEVLWQDPEQNSKRPGLMRVTWRSYAGLMRSFSAANAQKQPPKVARIHQCFYVLCGSLMPPRPFRGRAETVPYKTCTRPCIRQKLRFCFIVRLMRFLFVRLICFSIPYIVAYLYVHIYIYKHDIYKYVPI